MVDSMDMQHRLRRLGYEALRGVGFGAAGITGVIAFTIWAWQVLSWLRQGWMPKMEVHQVFGDVTVGDWQGLNMMLVHLGSINLGLVAFLAMICAWIFVERYAQKIRLLDDEVEREQRRERYFGTADRLKAKLPGQ